MDGAADARDRAMDVELGRIVTAESGADWQRKVARAARDGTTVAVGAVPESAVVRAAADDSPAEDSARDAGETPSRNARDNTVGS